MEKSAIKAVTLYLESLSQTKEVISVESLPKYRKIDIDLIWIKKDETQTSIEVKGDTYRSGNFAFETISNQSLRTPGCFLYTEADFVFYYFINWQKLYILPMPKTREWFIPLRENYRTIYPKTINDRTGEYLYTTVCKLVPIKDVLEAFPEIQVIQL
ncbi:MAG: hypothetical protein ACRCU2_29225 [Planktothrix sp.]